MTKKKKKGSRGLPAVVIVPLFKIDTVRVTRLKITQRDLPKSGSTPRLGKPKCYYPAYRVHFPTLITKYLLSIMTGTVISPNRDI